MAYIGKVVVGNGWQKLEDLIKALDGQSSFAFDADTTYQLQQEGDLGVRFCEKSSITDDDEGFYIDDAKVAMYKPSSDDLYVRNMHETNNKVLLKISSLEA